MTVQSVQTNEILPFLVERTKPHGRVVWFSHPTNQEASILIAPQILVFKAALKKKQEEKEERKEY